MMKVLENKYVQLGGALGAGFLLGMFVTKMRTAPAATGAPDATT